MSHDDSRGNESPDRPHASTEDTRARADTKARLEIIDRQTRALLESERVSEDSEAVRHCHEIRAEVDRVRLSLLGPEAVLEGLPPDVEGQSDSGSSSEATDADPDTDSNSNVPMIADRGEQVTTYLGPDPDAYEREHGDRDA